MPTGEHGVSDVPAKAIQAQDVIYQASALMAVTKDVIPMEEVVNETIKFDVTKGVVGRYNVPFDAEGDHRKLQYDTLTAQMVWVDYPYMINDKAKLQAREVSQLWDDALVSASEYFATARDYNVITALAAGYVGNHTATAQWDADGADPEEDLVKAINHIRGSSNYRPGETMTAIVPADVEGYLDLLNLIKNVQQRMRDYIEGSFPIQIVGFRPMLNESGTKLMDALGSDAYVVVNGRNTARHFQYSTAEAARRDCPLIEHSRIHNRGDYYTQKMGLCTRVVHDRLQSTDTKSNRIYKIATVT